MDLQKACEILEELSEKDSVKNQEKLNLQEFMALQMVLLELQASGKYTLPEKYAVDI